MSSRSVPHTIGDQTSDEAGFVPNLPTGSKDVFSAMGDDALDMACSYMAHDEFEHFHSARNYGTSRSPQSKKRRNCILLLDNSKFAVNHLPPIPVAVGNFSSQEVKMRDVSKSDILHCPFKNQEIYSFYFERYFEKNKLHHLSAICIDIQHLYGSSQDFFSSIENGLRLVKKYLAKVERIFVLFEKKICFGFLVNVKFGFEAISNILVAFKSLKKTNDGNWDFPGILFCFLHKKFEVDIELNEVFLSADKKPLFHNYDMLEEDKKSKIFWFLTAFIESYWDQFPSMAPLCCSFLHNVQWYAAGQCFDFSRNSRIREIELRIPPRSPATFKLPGESELTETFCEGIFKSPHPLEKLCLYDYIIDHFDLKRISSSLFSNLVELKLNFPKFLGRLQGKFLPNLKILKLVGLNIGTIIDFGDVDVRLQKLDLLDCQGTVLMEHSPVLLSVRGSSKIDDKGTFLSRVSNLYAIMYEEADTRQFPLLFGFDKEKQTASKADYIGEYIQQLELICITDSVLKKEAYMYEMKALTHLSIQYISAVIHADLLPCLRSLKVVGGSATLKSIFSGIETLILTTKLENSDYVIPSEFLRKFVWKINDYHKVVVYDNAIRGFSSETAFNEFLDTRDPLLAKKRVVFSNLEEFEYCTESDDTKFIFHMELSDICSLKLKLPRESWFLLQNVVLNCVYAEFVFNEPNVSRVDENERLQFPYMPNIKELSLKSFDTVYLDGTMNNLVHLTVFGYIFFGGGLSCLKLKFVYAGYSFEEILENYQSALKSVKFGKHHKWLYDELNDITYKISPNFDAPPSHGAPEKLLSSTMTSATAVSFTSNVDTHSGIFSNTKRSCHVSLRSEPTISEQPLSRSSWCSCCFSSP